MGVSVIQEFKQSLKTLGAYNKFLECFYSPLNKWRGTMNANQYLKRKIEVKTTSFNNILFDAFDFRLFDLEYWTRISEKLREMQSK